MRTLYAVQIATALFLVSASPAIAQDPNQAKFEEYSTIVNKVGGEMFASTPETWDYGVLTIQSDGIGLTYQLKNDTSLDKASISPELMDAIDELYVRMRNHGDVWTAAKIEFRKVDGDVKLSSSFTYPEK